MKQLRAPAIAVLFSWALVVGCSNPGSDTSTDSVGGKADNTGGTVEVPTREHSIRVLDGYNIVLDQAKASCVAAVASSDGAAFNTGMANESFDIEVVDSRAQLAHDLGLTASLGGSFVTPIGGVNVDGTFNFLKSYDASTTSIYVLLTSQATYRVTNARKMQLGTDALAHVQAHETDALLASCGNRYVNEIAYGAKVFVLLRIDADTETDSQCLKLAINAGLGRNPSGGGNNTDCKITNSVVVHPNDNSAGISGGLDVLLKDTLSKVHASLGAVAASEGFVFSGDGITLLSGIHVTDTSQAGALDAAVDTLTTQVNKIAESMGKSVRYDACRDGGPNPMGLCVPGMGGYPSNTARNAIPLSVVTGDYTQTANMPTGFNLRRALDDRLQPASDLVAAYSKLSRGLQTAIYDELTYFLQRSPAQKVGFNLAAPAPAKTRWEDVAAIAQTWQGKLQPSLDKVSKTMSDCLDDVSIGIYDTCAVAPEVITPIQQALQDYTSQGRVLPLHYAVVNPDHLLPASQASTVCAMRKDASGNAMALPTQKDVERLGPVVNEGTNYAGYASHTIWYQNSSCQDSGGVYQIGSGGAVNESCGSCNILSCDQHGALCVSPQVGAQGPAPDLLQGQTY